MKTLSVLLFMLCSVNPWQDKILGTWLNHAFGYQMTLVLRADGTGEFDGEAIRYSVKDNKFTLFIVADAQTIVYNYVLQGNSLTMSGGDLDVTVVFARKETSGDWTVYPPPSANVFDKNLIGLWSGNNETIEFTKDGKCSYIGQTYPYQVANGQVTLQTVQGNLTMAYAVKGNQLSLTVNGQTLQYTKGNAAVSQNKTQNSGGGKRVAQELVGKWCYVNVNSTNSGGSSTEQCITLNADGTYEYYGETSRSVNTNAYAGGTNSQSSDRGTWTYDGSRVYYTSTAGAGSGSYVLEKINHPKNNDPMIVLDGTTYVTQYQKAPWK